MFESLIIDPDSGQPLNATFLDYLLPAAGEMPDFEVTEVEYPDPTNPEGFKGVAEGGVMPPMAAICAAVENALRPWRIKVDTLPVTPNDLFHQCKGGTQ
jgi:carbon-monoxide dehydrogenase large subunit